MLTPTQKLALEALIDSDDLPSVIAEIAAICHGKAEHLSSNWQDIDGMRAWDRAGNVIDRLADHSAVRAVRVRASVGLGAGVRS